ncbi:hypothetical protein JW979_10060 [bacterium]|nr:hypothetical protein [candidate division CSSED10-310 bacterium]
MTKKRVAFVVMAYFFLVVFAFCTQICISEDSLIPSKPGFYYAAEGKYVKLPDCHGEDCEKSVSGAWIEAAKLMPVDGHNLTLVVRSLVTPPDDVTKNSDNASTVFLAQIVTLRIESSNMTLVEGELNIPDPTNGVITISFKKDVPSGLYVVLQGVPDAKDYGIVRLKDGGLSFISFDAKYKIIGIAKPIGVFVAR